LISFTDGNFTAAGTWKTVCAGSGANLLTFSAWATVTASYVATPTFTIPNGEVVDGVVLSLRLYADGTTGTLTVGLFDGAVELTTGTLTIADLSPNDKQMDEDYVLIKFGASQTGDGGSDYTIKVKADVTNKIQIYRGSATAGDWWRVLRTTTTSAAAPTTGDVTVVVGESLGGTTHTVTMNETATTAYGEMYIGGAGILSYGYSAATNYVLRLGGYLRQGCNGVLRIGTVANPIPRDSTAVLEFVCASMGQYYYYNAGGEFTAQGLSRTSAKNVAWALLTADMGTSATSCSINADTGWKNGDVVALFPTGWTTGGGETVTLNADAGGSSLAWTAGTTYTHKATTPTAGEVALLTRNVKIRSTSSSYYTCVRINGYAPAVDIDWVEFAYCGATTVNFAALDVIASSHATIHVDYCSFWGGRYATLYARNAFYGTIAATYNVVWYMVNNADTNFNTQCAAGASVTITDNVVGVAQGANCAGMYSYTPQYVTMSRNRHAGGDTGFVAIAGDDDVAFVAFEDNVAHSVSNRCLFISQRLTGIIDGFTGWGSNIYGVWWGSLCQNLTLTDCTFIGCATACLVVDDNYGLQNVTFSNLVTRGDASRSSALAFRFDPGSTYLNVFFDNCSFGAGTAHSTAVLETVNSVRDTGIVTSNMRFRDCTIGSNTLIGPLMTAGGVSYGSWIAFEKLDTAPIHRRFTDVGWITYDTATYHTASPAEKVSPVTATSTYRMLSAVRQIKVNASGTRTISVWVYKDGSYAGSAPRLIVAKNPALGWDTDQLLDTMTVGATTWEQLTGVTSAAGIDGVIEVYVDCDGSAGAIYVDDWTYV
jgi:hypothetical protein